MRLLSGPFASSSSDARVRKACRAVSPNRKELVERARSGCLRGVARGASEKPRLGCGSKIQDHIPDRDAAASFRAAGRREYADGQVLDWEVRMTVRGGYPTLSFGIMGFVEPHHRCSSALLRIEMLLQTVPVGAISLLKRTGLGREGRNSLRKSRFEHERHRSFELVGL